MPVHLKLGDKNFPFSFFNKVTNHLTIPHCTAYVQGAAEKPDGRHFNIPRHGRVPCRDTIK